MEKSVVNEFSDDILIEAAERYGFSKESLKYINDFENYIYEFQRDNNYFILRLTHSSHRTEELVNGELDWIHYLHKKGASVCNPVFSNNNQLVEKIYSKNSYFLATVFEKAKGEHVNRNNDAVWNYSLFEKWGQTVGKMHILTKNYSPSNNLHKRFELFEDDLYKNGGEYIKSYGYEFPKNLENLMNWCDTLPKNSSTYGLVHTDVHQGNFFYNNGNITVFDFDDCAYSWFINDIAIILFYVVWGMPLNNRNQKNEFASIFLKHFLKGYCTENSLDPSLLRTVPNFLKLREIVVFAVLNKKWDFENLSERQKEIVESMKYNIGNNIPYLDIDFNSFSSSLS
jgi:amicoumacin kinase